MKDPIDACMIIWRSNYEAFTLKNLNKFTFGTNSRLALNNLRKARRYEESIIILHG